MGLHPQTGCRGSRVKKRKEGQRKEMATEVPLEVLEKNVGRLRPRGRRGQQRCHWKFRRRMPQEKKRGRRGQKAGGVGGRRKVG